jgi:Ser/Thr protein kinase RdoA (MazF antagonist)
MPLTEELEQALSTCLGSRAVVRDRRPCPYRTSFPVEELDIELSGGSTLALVFKETGWESLDEEARLAKPRFLHDPLRELEAYVDILQPGRLGTAMCHGAVERAGSKSAWLFLERLSGSDLTEIGEFAVWLEAARWLARMHDRCRDVRGKRLLVYDSNFYERWLERALAFSPQGSIDAVAAAYGQVAERLLALRPAFIHGELYASNVLVETGGARPRICPIDWELAAVGPPLVDLAALSAGRWSEEQRLELARAYRETLSEPPAEGELRRELDWCRLHLAVQWLGWSAGWTPPVERQHDWLGEAVELAKRIVL